ncbi:shikimate kinase [Geomonas sp.]|uniref:shikimate kinase n=1 Tax=Geomonas sp. TaxID=2651584 RepID=UPI002B495FCC|nr:shikimate kinase [Geomonas sp.]HJV35551.1 shikimate kinase [Geomonas sp.]
MNLVLIGYRGTGKSHVGQLLAARLGMPRVVMDDEIEKRAGMSTNEIVAKWGWPKFRDIESEIARELSNQDRLVIDTGGGVIERAENMEALSRNGRIIWLKASVETIVSRIESGTHRPALVAGKTFTEEVAEVLERRTPLYQSAANYVVETDGMSPYQVAEMVVELWQRQD